MDEPEQRPRTQCPSRRNGWRVLRLILGQLQIIGATAAFLLLLSQGVTEIVLWIFSSTLAVSVTSIVLFRILKVQERDPSSSTD